MEDKKKKEGYEESAPMETDHQSQHEPTDPQPFDITVYTLTEKRVRFTVNETWTVAQLKKAIYDAESSPLHEQCLLFNCRQLRDEERTLVSYGIEPDAIIFLTLQGFKFCSEHSAMAPLAISERDSWPDSATRRLAREFRFVEDMNIAHPDAFGYSFNSSYPIPDPQDPPENLFIFLHGPPGSPYEGAKFDLHIQFWPTHPFKPPRMKFREFIFHTHVDDEGLVRINSQCCKWSPAVTLYKYLRSIRSLFLEVLPYGIPERMAEYEEDPIKFQKKARDCVRFYHFGERSVDLHYVAPLSLKVEFREFMLVHQRLTNPDKTTPCLPQLPIEMLLLILEQLQHLYGC